MNTRLLQARDKVKKLVNKHRETLSRKRVRLLTIDDYGNENWENWEKECQYFVDNVLNPAFDSEERDAIRKYGVDQFFEETLNQNIRNRQHMFMHEQQLPSNISPIEFEHWCAEQLVWLDWDCRVTKTGGDQGADIICTKGNRKLAVQCKLYSGTVSNKAVQEVHSAMKYYHCSEAAVISTSGYTQSAKDLAKSTSVQLLLHDEITSKLR